MAAISFGEVPNTFDPEISEWGNLSAIGRSPCMRTRTEGSETSQYLQEKKAIAEPSS